MKVDKGLKSAWDKLAKVIRSAKHRGAVEFDALWEAVAHVVEHDPPLYVVAGYANAEAFFEAELGEKSRNAYRYMRVAKFASPAEEDRYGTTKLDAALSFVEAKLGQPLEHPPLPIAFDRLRIPTTHGKTIALEKARVEDIDAATRSLSKQVKAPTSSAERALLEACKRHPAFGGVRARVRNGLATVTNVPVASMHVFGTMLTEVAWPAGNAASAKSGASSAAKKTKRASAKTGSKKKKR